MVAVTNNIITTICNNNNSSDHKCHKLISKFSDNSALGRKIKGPFIGLKPSTRWLLRALRKNGD